MEWIDSASPRQRARVIGAVYLVFFVTAVVSALIPPGIGGPGGLPTDATATANSIVAQKSSYEIAYAFTLASDASYIALAALFYLLFRGVSRTYALLMAFFQLVGCVVTAVGSLLLIAPVAVLSGSSYLSVFDGKQLDALALLLLNLSAEAGSVALVFFGVFQLFLGYLIFRSKFLPRLIGVVIAIAGVGWLTYLYPPLSSFLSNELAVLGFAAELILMLWLLVFGVNEGPWTERNRADSGQNVLR